MLKKALKWIILIVMAIFVLSAITVSIHRTYEIQKLADLAEDMSQSYNTSESISENEELEVDFSTLKNLNPDIYAWIDIPNSKISFPVLQSGENRKEDYYLHHNFDGSYGLPASIYSQKQNAKDFSDPVTVLYGHNMKDGSMFAGLHRYSEGDYMLENPYVYIYTESGILVYEIFAAVSYDDRLILEAFSDFKNTEDVVTFTEELRNLQGDADMVDDSVAVQEESQLLVLSTCEKDRDRRFLVVGKRIR
ncbi:MAG: class B sortase [Lachnospiraceae bacterium]|nr:class B sortase [Lachnospiraceae bacterium]